MRDQGGYATCPELYARQDPNYFSSTLSTFNFEEYIETERELWALFPETDGKRVNFLQVGLTAQIFAQMADDASEPRLWMKAIRSPQAVVEDFMTRPNSAARRRLTPLLEYRMGHLTAIKLIGSERAACGSPREIGCQILGAEVLEEAQSRIAESSED